MKMKDVSDQKITKENKRYLTLNQIKTILEKLIPKIYSFVTKMQ